MRQPSIRLGKYYAILAAAIGSLLIYGSLVPFRFVSLDLAVAVEQFRTIVVAPWNFSGGRGDWSVNYLITVPLAFCGMGLFLADRATCPRLLWVPLVVLAGAACLSCGVEFAQLWSAERVSSMRDVIAQFLGAVTGVALWMLCGRGFTHWLRSVPFRQTPREKVEWILQAYVLGLLVYSILPLDVMTTPGELIRKYESGRFELIPFSHSYGSRWDALYGYVTQVLLYLPVGAWVVVAWRRSGEPMRGLFHGWFYGVLMVVGIEIAQILIISRFTSATDLLLGSGGVMLGVFAIRRFRGTSIAFDATATATSVQSGARAAAWIFSGGLYAALLPIVFWAPYHFSHDRQLIKHRLSEFASVPFLRMQGGSDLQAIFSSLCEFVWFMPLGVLFGLGIACLSRASSPPRGLFLVGMAAIAVVAIGVELGQVWVPERFADLTDAAICAAGGVFSLWLTGAILSQRRCSPAEGRRSGN